MPSRCTVAVEKPQHCPHHSDQPEITRRQQSGENHRGAQGQRKLNALRCQGNEPARNRVTLEIRQQVIRPKMPMTGVFASCLRLRRWRRRGQSDIGRIARIVGTIKIQLMTVASSFNSSA